MYSCMYLQNLYIYIYIYKYMHKNLLQGSNQVKSSVITHFVSHVCLKVCKTAAGLKIHLKGDSQSEGINLDGAGGSKG